MKRLLLLCLLTTLSACVAEFPENHPYGERDHYGHDWDQGRHEGDNRGYEGRNDQDRYDAPPNRNERDTRDDQDGRGYSR